MSYRIYRNLHKGNFTVQGWIEGQGWRKIDEGEIIEANDVWFRVYTSGQNRVREERCKNVHAYVCCEEYEVLTQWNERGWAHDKYWQRFTFDPKRLDAVRYNPYEMDTFQWAKDGTECEAVERLTLTPDGNFSLDMSESM